ncbi:hypothetical protein SLA2020_163760 [Shorea laevis]
MLYFRRAGFSSLFLQIQIIISSLIPLPSSSKINVQFSPQISITPSTYPQLQFNPRPVFFIFTDPTVWGVIRIE